MRSAQRAAVKTTADRKARKCVSRHGQALIFIIMAVTVLTFVLLWNVDLHRIVSLKTRSQHAGDAAALAAARWQGTTLNLIGELNLMQALALATGDSAAADAITNIQARLCFTGPMVGLIAAQVAAKNNRMYEEPAFSELLRRHAVEVRNSYTAPVGNGMLFPEPYPDAWAEYADMLDTAAAHGIAAGPDNARFFSDRGGGHVLLNRGFYDAVAGRDWCWFYNHEPGLLDAYTNYRWWPHLPEPDPPTLANSEIFGLGLLPLLLPMERIMDTDTFADAAASQDYAIDPAVITNVVEQSAVWYVYHDGLWGAWSQMDTEGADPFPAAGRVRPQFDYAGADAAVRVLAGVDRSSPHPAEDSHRDVITWTAAAKPFGWLEDDQRPNAYRLVLPAFREVRLIPVDASSAPESGAFDIAWRQHVEEHLPLYMQFGPRSHAGCWYCAQLRTWEDAAFRQTGSSWLLLFSDLCIVPASGGGGGRGGGRRRGH